MGQRVLREGGQVTRRCGRSREWHHQSVGGLRGRFLQKSCTSHDRRRDGGGRVREETKENEIEKTTKSQDVKYKAKESKELDKYAAELKSDRSGVQGELDAVLEYLATIEKRCIAVAGTYENRAARREAEIAGLKQALDILESETALVQSSRKHRSFRGALQACVQPFFRCVQPAVGTPRGAPRDPTA